MMPASKKASAGADEPGRQERRKLRTRARLVEAARRVVGRKGVEPTTIQDITDEADVGFGTFYNYFPSKDAVLAAVTADVADELGQALARATAPLDDPAEVIAVSVRHLVRLVEHDPLWGWFVVHTGVYREQMTAVHVPRLARDVQRGIRAGRFAEANAPLLLAAIGGTVWSVLRGVLRKELKPGADAELAALVLRLLGLPAREARAVAARPLPALHLAPRRLDA